MTVEVDAAGVSAQQNPAGVDLARKRRSRG
jgi:hypothetical protein